jgi:hypothetical protein
MDQIPEEQLLFELNSSSIDSSSDEDYYNNIETDKYNDDKSPESINYSNKISTTISSSRKSYEDTVKF